jgi:Trypsin-co-occurring domain 1
MEARMAARMIVEFPSGNKILFGGRGDATGLSDVAARDDVAKATGDQFQKALGSLADITAAVEQSVGRMAHRPEKVEMEFSASLTAECDLWIVSGKGEAEFKVTLAWGKEG